MNFRDHKIDVEKAYHAIALEFAKSDLKECELQWESDHRAVSPQDKMDALRDAYFIAYGHLCDCSESYLQHLLKSTYPDD